MDIMEIIKNRHSVRKYLDRKIEKEKIDILMELIEESNFESGLNIQLLLNEPQAFSGLLSSYGKFDNVKNYIAIVGRKDDKALENCGYYGEKIVIKAQEIGLNTCWVGLNYKKIDDVIKIKDEEKLHLVIALGYGENEGIPRKSKTFKEVTNLKTDPPKWFIRGVEAALYAPTALNQQSFIICLEDNKVKIMEKMGFYSKLGVGIVKYHFESGAGRENFIWS